MAPQPGDIVASLFTGAAVILLTNPLDTVKNKFQVAKTRSGVLAFGAADGPPVLVGGGGHGEILGGNVLGRERPAPRAVAPQDRVAQGLNPT